MAYWAKGAWPRREVRKLVQFSHKRKGRWAVEYPNEYFRKTKGKSRESEMKEKESRKRQRMKHHREREKKPIIYDK